MILFHAPCMMIHLPCIVHDDSFGCHMLECQWSTSMCASCYSTPSSMVYTAPHFDVMSHVHLFQHYVHHLSLHILALSHAPPGVPLISRIFIVHVPFFFPINLGLSSKEHQMISSLIMLTHSGLLAPAAMLAWSQTLLSTSGEPKESSQYRNMRMIWRFSNFLQSLALLSMVIFVMTITTGVGLYIQWINFEYTENKFKISSNSNSLFIFWIYLKFILQFVSALFSAYI